MTERRNTMVCIFDQHSPKITAFHIHEWIHDTLQLEEDEVSMIQIGILKTFAKYMRNKFDTHAVNENEIRDILVHMKTRLSPEENVELEAPITMEEMEMAVRQGKNAKAPGHDGISHDFLKHKWKTIRHDLLQILNEMYVDKAILNSQKHGIIVCVPKKR
jgi:hypothetical protein